MPRSFVIGDIHGNYSQPVRVVDELMKIRHFIFIQGNHDFWCHGYLKYGHISPDWLFQGGKTTISAYENHPDAVSRHLDFFASAIPFYIDSRNRLFVHGGFDPDIPFTEQVKTPEVFLWDRDLFRTALEFRENGKSFSEFSEIYIGHSPTQLLSQDKPVQLGNLWMLDTGAGHRRFLTLMDPDSKKYLQSRCDF